MKLWHIMSERKRHFDEEDPIHLVFDKPTELISCLRNVGHKPIKCHNSITEIVFVWSDLDWSSLLYGDMNNVNTA